MAMPKKTAASESKPCTACAKSVQGHESRGLCRKCYLAIRLLVKSGALTWKDCEETGVSLPPYRAQKASINVILERFPALRKRLAGKKESAASTATAKSK